MAGVVFGIVTRLPAGWSKGLNLGKSEEFFFVTKLRHQVCVPHCLLLSGHCVSFPTVRRPKNDADHSPPSSAGFKNKWSCVYVPPWPGHAQIYPIISYHIYSYGNYWVILSNKYLSLFNYFLINLYWGFKKLAGSSCISEQPFTFGRMEQSPSKRRSIHEAL